VQLSTNLRRWPDLITVCCVWLLASCAGDPAGGTAPAPEVAPLGTAAPLGLRLPQPQVLPPERGTSISPLYARSGAEADTSHFPPQRAANAGSGLVFQPAWTEAEPTVEGLAYALYRFNVSGYSGEPLLQFSLKSSGEPADCWVAVGDFAANRWQFHGLDAGHNVALTPAEFAAATAPASQDFWVLVVFTGEASWELSSIRIGSSQAFLKISAVSPLSGWPGTQVYIAASTDKPLPPNAEWEWDFGGAVATQEMYGKFGFLRLSSVSGSYQGHVRCTSWPDEANYDFTFTVRDPAPPNIQGFKPASVGIPGSWSQGTGDYLEMINTGGPATAWSWDFGGGAEPGTSLDQYPSVVWQNPGSYTAILTASNAEGSSSINFGYTVELPQPPELEYVYSQGAMELLPFELQAAFAGPYVSDWSWDFGGAADPNTNTAARPVITPLAPGSYNCHVTASNPGGSSDLDFVLEVEALQPPHIVQVEPLTVLAGATFLANLANDGGPITAWSWDFGGGCLPNTSTDPQPQVQALGAGTYHCTVQISNPKGSDTYAFDLEVQ
jgi:hypothetical protein